MRHEEARGLQLPAGSSGRKPGLLGLPPETAASGTEERRWQWVQTRPCVRVRGLIVISDASPHRPPLRVPAAGQRGRLGRRASVAIGRRAASVQGMGVSPAAWPPRGSSRGPLSRMAPPGSLGSQEETAGAACLPTGHAEGAFSSQNPSRLTAAEPLDRSRRARWEPGGGQHAAGRGHGGG